VAKKLSINLLNKLNELVFKFENSRFGEKKVKGNKYALEL
jgi:hypothetical protein